MRGPVAAATLLLTLSLGAACRPALPIGGPPGAAAAPGQPDTAVVAQREGADDAAALVAGNHRLAADLYQRLSAATPPNRNLVMAPGSVFVTLATVAAAEKGEPETDLRKALTLTLERDRLQDALTRLAAGLKKHVVVRPQVFLGLQVEPVGEAGVRVKAVVPDSAAALAGFQVGDRLVSINLADAPGAGQPIRTVADFVHALDEAPPVIRVRCRPKGGDEQVTRRLRLIPHKKPAAPREAPLRQWEALWHPADAPLPASLLDYAKEARDVADFPVNFAKDAKKVRAWFGKRLRPERDVTLPESALAGDLRALFTNALYFEPRWSSAVQVGAVSEIPFQVGTRKTPVPAIPLSGRFHVGKLPKLQTVELPCAGTLALVFLMPLDATGLAGLEKELAAPLWPKLFGAGTLQEATVVVPELDLRSLHDLRGPLAKLGLARVFPPADDEAAKPNPSKVGPAGLLQQTQLRLIVEDAKEPADDANGPAPGATRITLERGFVFFVYDRRTGEIVLLGRVANPRSD